MSIEYSYEEMRVDLDLAIKLSNEILAFVPNELRIEYLSRLSGLVSRAAKREMMDEERN